MVCYEKATVTKLTTPVVFSEKFVRREILSSSSPIEISSPESYFSFDTTLESGNLKTKT